MKKGKSKFEEIIDKNSSDTLAILICHNLLKEEILKKLTLEQCLKAAESILFERKRKAEKIYRLLLTKASTTEDFAKMSQAKNSFFLKEELWQTAKDRAINSWDFYALLSYSQEKEERDLFFKKTQENLKNFDEVKKILRDDRKIRPDKQSFLITPYEKIKLVDQVKRFAKTFDDYYFIFMDKARASEEREYFFKKMKNSFQTIEEAKILLSYSHILCKKKERIEILKLVANSAKNERDFEEIISCVYDYRERKIIKNIQNKKKE